jgi:putative transposase
MMMRALEKILIELRHIQPGRPMQNEHVESFHSRLREECLRTHWFRNLFDARIKISGWKTEYNEVRPHSSLAYRTPSEFAMACQQPRVEELESAYGVPQLLNASTVS